MNNFFQKYSEAFDSLDANTIASLYMTPCATSDSDGVQVFYNRESLLKKFHNNCLSMKSMGYKSSNFNILSETNLGKESKAINIGWRVELEKSEIEFRSLYICQKSNNRWLIFSANVYEGSFLNET